MTNIKQAGHSSTLTNNFWSVQNFLYKKITKPWSIRGNAEKWGRTNGQSHMLIRVPRIKIWESWAIPNWSKGSVGQEECRSQTWELCLWVPQAIFGPFQFLRVNRPKLGGNLTFHALLLHWQAKIRGVNRTFDSMFLTFFNAVPQACLPCLRLLSRLLGPSPGSSIPNPKF